MIDTSMGLACVLLSEGKLGVEQDPFVKRYLLQLERRKYVVYEAKGWRLTDSGRKLAAEMRKTAHRYARTGEVE